MATKVFLGEDGYIEQVYAGEQTERSLLKAVAKAAALVDQLRTAHLPANILVDISGLERLTIAARKTTVSALQEIPYDRIAIYGANSFTKALVNLIIHAAGKGNTVQLFNSRTEAQQWLAQNQTPSS